MIKKPAKAGATVRQRKVDRDKGRRPKGQHLTKMSIAKGRKLKHSTFYHCDKMSKVYQMSVLV